MNSIDQRLKKIFEDRNNRMMVIGFGIIFLAILVWAFVSMFKRENQAGDFIRREIQGVLTEIRYDQHGEYTIAIHQHGTKEVLSYYLFLSPFIKDNNIEKYDSISKVANGHTINFFKKKEGNYYKCCELYYY